MDGRLASLCPIWLYISYNGYQGNGGVEEGVILKGCVKMERLIPPLNGQQASATEFTGAPKVGRYRVYCIATSENPSEFPNSYALTRRVYKTFEVHI